MKQLNLNEINVVTGGLCACVCGAEWGGANEVATCDVANDDGCEKVCKMSGLYMSRCEEIKE